MPSTLVLHVTILNRLIGSLIQLKMAQLADEPIDHNLGNLNADEREVILQQVPIFCRKS